MHRLSRNTFLRTFESITGVTPHQFIIARATAGSRDAARSVRVSRTRASTIALDCGFGGDVSNFNRAFRTEFRVFEPDRVPSVVAGR